MARFEFGKGKRKSSWEITRINRMLRVHEVVGPTEMLPGYRCYPDERSMRAELERLVTERLAKRFVPTDDEARAIAAQAGKPAGPKKAASTLPLRQDLYVYNEATGFMVTSMAMAGVALEEGSRKWNRAVQDGKMIPVTLFQDDPFVVRVVAGEPLSAQEFEEWVACIDRPLHVPDGKLAITGGAVLVNDEYDPNDAYFESYLRVVEIPPGHYRARVYTYVPGINGYAVLDHLAGGYGKSERPGRWFRHTRAGLSFPAWLKDWCIGNPSADPDHQDQWTSVKRLERSETPGYVNFLVHLEPMPRTKGKTMAWTELPSSEGWFGGAENGRRPERCPLGLEAVAVLGHKDETEGSQWMYVNDVYSKTSRFTPLPIRGGPVIVPPRRLSLLYRLAWFSHSLSVPEIRAVLPRGSTWALPEEQPEQTVQWLEDRVLRIAFSNALKPVALFPKLENAGLLLSTLPEGTELELASSQIDDAALHVDTPLGLHRYRGCILNGTWHVEQAFPNIDANMLRQALALAEEVATGQSIAISNDAEGTAVLERAQANHGPWIEDNPARIEQGRLVLAQPEPKLLALYGSNVFAVRFGQTWPVLDLSEEAVGEEAEDNVEPSIPVRGQRILETPGGRMYFETNALTINQPLKDIIRQSEESLESLGFKHVGDLVCNLFRNIVVRGYARETGDIWATFLVASPSTLVFELSTRFTNEHASLLTTRKLGAQDDLVKHSYRQTVVEGTHAELLNRHESRKAELMALYGSPIPVLPTLDALAEAVEAALKKQLGG